MSGITSRVLQDISLSLPQKGIQLSSSRLHSTPSSRRFWSFFEFSRKENVPPDLQKIPLSTNSASPSLFAPRKGRNASEPAVSSATTSMPSAVSLSAKRACFSFTSKIPQNSASKLSESRMEADSFMSLLDDNVSSNMKWKLKCYKALRHENVGDFAFLANPVKSPKQDLIPEREDQSKSAPEERHLPRIKSPNQINQEMSAFGSSAVQESSRNLVRSQTVTKFDVNKTAVSVNTDHEIPTQLPPNSGSSNPGKSESQLAPLKSSSSDRPSRLPIRIQKASSITPKPPKSKIHQQLSESATITRTTLSYQKPSKGVAAPEFPTPLRLQPHPRGSAASRSGTVGFGQPLAGNSGDGGSRKPPAFPRPPITSSEQPSPTRANGDPWLKKSATISMSGAANYSTKKSSCGGNSNENNAKPAKKPKQKEECKRYCCPSMNDDFECDIADCSKNKEDNDCYRPPAKRSSCAPVKKDKCGSQSSYTPPPPSKKSSPCRSPSPTPSDCTTQIDRSSEYTYQVCCQNDCRDRKRNYQVCCPDENTSNRRPSKRSESKCPPPPMEGKEICTKPPPNDCRPTKCPDPKSIGGNQNRRYSQLASSRDTSSSTGGTRHFSTLSSVHSTSPARRLAAGRVLERSFASDPCKPKKEDPCKPKKVDPCKPVEKPKKKKLELCRPPERPKEDPCKPVAKAKQPIACKPVVCDTKKSKPSPKCLPNEKVSVLKKKPSNSCAPSEKKSTPKKSKSDEYCVDKGSKGGESSSARAKREQKEADACKTKKKKDPCKPFASLEPKKQGDGLQRVVSPCKQKQLSKKAEKKGNSSCSKFTLPGFLSQPFCYFNNVDNLLATNLDRTLLPNRLLSTSQQLPLNLSSSKDNRPCSFIDDIFNDDEVQEAPEPIPIESEEEDE